MATEIADNSQQHKQALQSAFLEAFCEIGTISGASRAVGMSRDVFYEWTGQRNASGVPDEDFIKAYSQAQIEFGDRLEREAVRRAIHGNRQYKFNQAGRPLKHPEICLCSCSLHDHAGRGGACTTEDCRCPEFEGRPYFEQNQSDTMLIFLMKGHLPEKYRERYDVRGEIEHAAEIRFYLPDNGRDDKQLEE